VEVGGGGLHALAHDGDYLYAAGFAVEDVDGDGDEEWIWRIERTADLTAFKFANIYAEGWDTGVVLDLAINPATGHLWAVGGYTDAAGVVHSLLVLLDRELREVRRVGHGLGLLHGICFDEEGNGYAAGRKGWQNSTEPAGRRPRAEAQRQPRSYAQKTTSTSLAAAPPTSSPTPSTSWTGNWGWRMCAPSPAAPQAALPQASRPMTASGYTPPATPSPPPGSSTQSPQPTSRGSAQSLKHLKIES